MKTNKLIFTALLTAMSLVTFVIEASIPPLTPIYGIKLGLSNIFTLFALYAIGKKEAFALLVIRITLGNIMTGQLMAFAYSISGGLLSFAVM
ncbi:MAG: Gx transporter family protein, partial [Ruminococcus sp.]|nr:Gx transporter family protein [Ruminococcus sp.]